ncbi:MAG: glycosyltransferase family 4 protein [Promethearchaeia archaeon]
MSKPFRLLIYNPLSTRMGGGGDRWLAEVVPRLMARGFEVTLMTTSFIPEVYRATSTSEYVEKIVKGGATYVEIPCSVLTRLTNRPLLTLDSFTLLCRAIAEHNLLYFMNAYVFQDIYVWLAKNLVPDSPVISAQHASMFHGSIPHDVYIRTVTRLLLNCFEAHHVLNEDDYKTYKQWRLDDVFLIPNGVNTDWFSPRESREMDKFRVLHVGRLEYQKGINILMKSIEFINQQLDSDERYLQFQICGSGTLSQVIKQFAETTPNVSYLGYVDDEELLRLYRNVSLFVMPSMRETFGLVALEAMSCGLPVIASDIPGPRTFVERSYGQKVPPGNPKALAKAILRFYRLWADEPTRYEEMGRLARKKCKEEYDWSRIVDRLAEMILDASKQGKQ